MEINDFYKEEICGSQMYLNPHDEGISRDLKENEIREPVSTYTYQDALEGRSSVTVVEIGANIGYYALQPCSILGDSAEVICIEPDPQNAEILRENISLNGYEDNMDVFVGAVGDETGKADLRRTKKSNLSTLHPRQHRGQEKDTISVDIKPLGDWLSGADVEYSDIDVLRMDVEGHEIAILRGAEPVLSEVNELLCHIEFHPTLFPKGGKDYLCGLFEVAPPDVKCLARDRAEFEYEGCRELVEREWSPQLVFDWDLSSFTI